MRSFWKERDPRISELSGESASRKRVDAALRNIVHPPARPVRCMLVYCVVGGYCRLPHVPSYGSWAAGERVPTGEDRLPQQPRVVGYSPDAIYVIHL